MVGCSTGREVGGGRGGGQKSVLFRCFAHVPTWYMPHVAVFPPSHTMYRLVEIYKFINLFFLLGQGQLPLSVFFWVPFKFPQRPLLFSPFPITKVI
jgi:hypothetical protein